MPTFTQDTIIVPLVRCHELPMFEGHPLAVTAQLEAAQIEITVLHHNGDSFESTRLTFLCPANSIEYPGKLANLPPAPMTPKLLNQFNLDARFTVIGKQWPYVFLCEKTTSRKAICLTDSKGHYCEFTFE